MLTTYILLCLTAAAAGAINSVAGGGTLLTFPVLFAALGSSDAAAVIANGTSTTALVPGALAATWGYRHEFAPEQHLARRLAIPSLVGGILGALLVVWFPESFKAAVPWLILTAALLFALQPVLSRWTGLGQPATEAGGGVLLGVAVLQFVISIYGGYFGAGIGILMLSGLGFMGLTNIHEMNALKSLLGTLINGASVIVFVASGSVNWPFAVAMGLSSIVGGYAGASVARRLNRNLVRMVVVLIGFTLAGYYFYRRISG